MGNERIANWPTWLRWGLAYPAALIGSLLFAWLIRISQGLFSSHDSVDLWWFDLLQNGFVGFFFVFISSWFAPKATYVVSLISMSVVIAVAFFLVGMAVLANFYGPGVTDPITFYLSDAVLITGAVVAVVAIHQESRSDD